MNYNDIENLINLVNSSAIEEFNYENNGVKINIKTKDDQKAHQPISEPVVETNETTVEASAEEDRSSLSEIKSPIVGVFYTSPSPDEQPFVEEGQAVKKGDVVCIVEAMKVMNEIKAKADGVIKEILVEDQAVVEYGQPLFLVE